MLASHPFRIRISLLVIVTTTLVGIFGGEAVAQFQQDFRMVRGNPSTRNIPLRSLDPKITYTKDKLSLIVDFESQENNRANVYLINDTKIKVPLENFTQELPIVLEAYLGDDTWERAEVRNDRPRIRVTSSGNKQTESVLPGYFRKRACSCWAEGAPVKLRYALYESGRPIATSDSFEGFLPYGVIDAARHDKMAESIVPNSLKIRYIPGETTHQEVAREWFSRLSLLKALGPCYVDLSEAQKWIASVHENPVSTREERDTAIRLQKWLLASEWSKDYDHEKLITHCHEIVKGKVELLPNTLAELRSLSWIVLLDWVETEKWLDSPELATIAWQTLVDEDASVSEKENATAFLCIDAVADAHSPILDDPNRDTLSIDSNPYRRIVSANWLMRQRRDRKSVV